MLQINEICKVYGGSQVLNLISLDIRPGMFGLLGPNGAGKTTLMRILTTVIPSTSGNIHYGDISWSNKNEVRKMIGYLPQKFSLYKQLRVNEALYHLAVLKGVSARLQKKMVAEVLDKVNLNEHQDKKVGHLSGGMVRRLGIAQAILGDPKIIIVDEPTAGLDPEERIRFRKLLRMLGEKSIVIISTHIVEDIESSCDQIAVLHKGQLKKHGNIDKIRASAKGKVWELTVSNEDFYKISDEWNVISNHKESDGYRLHILSDEKPEGALSIDPTLEDSYLYLMGGSGQNEVY
ncbi:ABC-type multidrug transport system, ATPase component [Marininema mesophilum]|uniref:ABC-type multidrug transport system, ATPase component n=1 Tax=Marininema mesophilum TaxID=1048340 RepID=A0A1H2Z0Z4_9BACL|nr:ABC transporter ATP-binding protein [Marininema mesophilum]SDX11016.1 ABC-type multidrug transport system, ATPase component [Marininema mesophilum]